MWHGLCIHQRDNFVQRHEGRRVNGYSSHGILDASHLPLEQTRKAFRRGRGKNLVYLDQMIPSQQENAWEDIKSTTDRESGIPLGCIETVHLGNYRTWGKRIERRYRVVPIRVVQVSWLLQFACHQRQDNNSPARAQLPGRGVQFLGSGDPAPHRLGFAQAMAVSIAAPI